MMKAISYKFVNKYVETIVHCVNLLSMILYNGINWDGRFRPYGKDVTP